MEKTLYGQMDGTYREAGDYFIPNLSLPDTEERTIGVWGNRRKAYLKNHHRILYYNLLTSCKLHEHLADINEQAEELYYQLVKQIAEKEGVTEQLKVANMMNWIGLMNNIRNAAMKITNKELICV